MSNPTLHLLGLAKRAGKLEIGEEPVGAVARAKHAKLILLASDASPNTSRRAATFGQSGNVLHLTLPFTKDEIGFALGRGSIAMLALTDAGFAGAIGQKLVLLDAQRYGPASEQLKAKADRTLARQKEKRQHEKNLQRGKGKPWAVPPKTQQALQDEKEKKKSKQHREPKSDRYTENRANYDKEKKHSSLRTNSSSQRFSKTSASSRGKVNQQKPSAGKRLIVKSKTGGRRSVQP